jgi:hypothetical protein
MRETPCFHQIIKTGHLINEEKHAKNNHLKRLETSAKLYRIIREESGTASGRILGDNQTKSA